jgi:hypothetical protein
MNSKAVIYIILSAILLYLYYKRGGFAIFAAFVAVVFGTLILGKGKDIEGNTGKTKSGSSCSALKFTKPTINKKKVVPNLIALNDNFKEVCSKYLNTENLGLNAEGAAIMDPIFKDNELKKQIDTIMKKLEKNQKEFFAYVVGTSSLLLNKKYEKSETGEMTFTFFGSKAPVKKILNDLTKDDYDFFKSAVSGANILLEIIDEIKNIDGVKKQGNKTTDIFNFMKCSVEHTIKVLNNLKGALPPYVDPSTKSTDDTKDKEEEE